MQNQLKGFERYPIWVVIVFNLISWSVYLAGMYLLYLIWPLLSILLLLYFFYLEILTYKEGCSCCYYYGKLCAFGRGKIAKIFFKRKDAKKFCEKSVSFKDFLPYSLVNFITLAAGIYLLIKDFNWIILLIAIWPFIVLFFGNPLIYGELACKNCKQAQICCPVCEFFKKRAEKKL